MLRCQRQFFFETLQSDIYLKYDAFTYYSKNFSHRALPEYYRSFESILRLAATVHNFRYNTPIVNEVAVIYVGDDNDVPRTREFAVHDRQGGQSKIRDIDKTCDPLTYPLLFPDGGEGWHPDLRKNPSDRKRTRITQKEYYCYLLHPRDTFNPILYTTKLFQQYIVDSWAKVEQNRLNYDRTHQRELRLDTVRGLTDYMLADDNVQG